VKRLPRYRRRPFRARVLGSGAIYEDVIEALRVAGCEVVFAGQGAGRKTVDLLVLAAETRIIRPEEIARYPLGALCFHPSLLPRHRGRDAVYWTLEMGDRETGATWFWLDAGIDTGPIASQEAVSIPPGTSRGRLYYDILVPLGGRLFQGLLARLLAGERPAAPQDEALATYEPPRPRPRVASNGTSATAQLVTAGGGTVALPAARGR
jgi:methionyl-tRNA formyltransferase